MKKTADFMQSYDHQAYVIRYCAKAWLLKPNNLLNLGLIRNIDEKSTAMKKTADFTQSYDHQAYVMRYCAKEDTSAVSQISDEEEEQTSHKEMEQPLKTSRHCSRASKTRWRWGRNAGGRRNREHVPHKTNRCKTKLRTLSHNYCCGAAAKKAQAKLYYLIHLTIQDQFPAKPSQYYA
ncbi:hypothetical protein LXL04_017797 [Taraxacum kok-saghyz]